MDPCPLDGDRRPSTAANATAGHLRSAHHARGRAHAGTRCAMARIASQDLAKLEEQAAKAKAAFEAKAARVRRAQQQQRVAHERALLRLLKSLGLTAYDVETLREPFTTLARALQATAMAKNAPGTGV